MNGEDNFFRCSSLNDISLYLKQKSVWILWFIIFMFGKKIRIRKESRESVFLEYCHPWFSGRRNMWKVMLIHNHNHKIHNGQRENQKLQQKIYLFTIYNLYIFILSCIPVLFFLLMDIFFYYIRDMFKMFDIYWNTTYRSLTHWMHSMELAILFWKKLSKLKCQLLVFFFVKGHLKILQLNKDFNFFL